MSVRILSTAVFNEFPDDPVSHASTAGELCIREAGVSRHRIDTLIFVGTTKFDFISEPSTACQIQRHLGINTSYDDHFAGRSTFSFDLNNTNCGFLLACQTIDALAERRGSKLALIVASDIHPAGVRAQEHDFSPVAAAALLAAGHDQQRGFTKFTYRTAPEKGPGLSASLDLYNSTAADRLSSLYHFEKDFIENAKAFLVNTINEHRAQWRGKPTAKLIATDLSPEFSAEIAQAIGLPPESVVDQRPALGPTHTTSLIAGFDVLRAQRKISGSPPILFAACGAGLTAMVATYDA